MIYFVHDKTSRTIKIGCAWNPGKRLSTLQISTSNELVLLGAISGMKRTEKKVHELVCKHCGPTPDDPEPRRLRVMGEWFDDRILPFVIKLIASPKEYLEPERKKPADGATLAKRDTSVRQCKLIFLFDSGEEYHEQYVLKAASPADASAALEKIAGARLNFLANTVQITQMRVPGSPTRKVSLRGLFVTQRCSAREGLSVIFSPESDNSYSWENGRRFYSNRWFHGVPEELCKDDSPWRDHPTAQFESFLAQFAAVLNQNRCVISAQKPLPVRGLLSRDMRVLPKGELRRKGNRLLVSKRKKQRSPEETPRPKAGIVYFIQDVVTLAIKIGFCVKNPEKRLAALQTGNSNTLRLLGHIAGSDAHEKSLHARFSCFHLKGEWFSHHVSEILEGILKSTSLEKWLKAQEVAVVEVSVQAVEAASVGLAPENQPVLQQEGYRLQSIASTASCFSLSTASPRLFEPEQAIGSVSGSSTRRRTSPPYNTSTSCKSSESASTGQRLLQPRTLRSRRSAPAPHPNRSSIFPPTESFAISNATAGLTCAKSTRQSGRKMVLLPAPHGEDDESWTHTIVPRLFPIPSLIRRCASRSMRSPPSNSRGGLSGSSAPRLTGSRNMSGASAGGSYRGSLTVATCWRRRPPAFSAAMASRQRSHLQRSAG